MKGKFISCIMLPLTLVMFLSYKSDNFWFPCLMTILFLDGLFGFIRITKNPNKVLKISDLKIIKTKWFPFGNFVSIALFGIIFTKDKNFTDKEKEHELGHKIQAYETGWFLMYFIYCLEFIYWFILFLIKGNPSKKLYNNKWSAAYHNVCFEQELYKTIKEPDYVINRTKYNWLNWLFEGSN